MPDPASLQLLNTYGFTCNNNQWTHPSGKRVSETDIRQAEQMGPAAVQALIRGALTSAPPPPQPPRHSQVAGRSAR